MDRKESRPPPPNPAMPYREDCWSEGATSALIDAWGDRYLELNRGNLRRKDWQEVADAVNSRRSGAKRPPRTDSQCKNRIDTLKKKYKVEKARVSDYGSALDSQWPFYPRLDVLIGPSVASAKKPSTSPPLALPLPAHRKASAISLACPVEAREKRPALALTVDDPLFRRNYSAAAAAVAAAAAEEGDSVSSASSSKERPAKRWRGRREGEGDEDGIPQLAQAIVRFAEIYEKMEGEKQRQIMDLEKQRMEFAKGVEFQRMQIYVDSQVQFEKMKRARQADEDDGYV